MSKIPSNDDLDAIDKYYLMASLGFHAISPATELNRILILTAAKRVFNDLSKEAYGFLASIFSTLYIFTWLMDISKWRDYVRELLRFICKRHNSQSRVGMFICGYFKYLCDPEGDVGLYEAVRRLILSDLPIYTKAKIFYDILRENMGDLSPWQYHRRCLKRIIIPISSDDIMPYSSDAWKEKAISTEDMEYLAQIDVNSATRLARKLDKIYSSAGKMPLYSESRTLIQKLLKEKRYIAAVRRARIRQIISRLETYLVSWSPSRSLYGYGSWYIGDDEEELNIEASAENFGKVVPNISTLRHIYETGDDVDSYGVGHIELCIDTSGSMRGEGIECAVDIGVSIVEIARKFGKSIGLTTFSSGAWCGLDPTQDYDLVEEIVLRLEAEGGTNIRYVFDVIDDHISRLTEFPLVVLVTDTYIYDINFPMVIHRLESLKRRARVLLVALTNELWRKSIDTILTVGIEIVKIAPRMGDLDNIIEVIDRAKNNMWIGR